MLFSKASLQCSLLTLVQIDLIYLCPTSFTYDGNLVNNNNNSCPRKVARIVEGDIIQANLHLSTREIRDKTITVLKVG